MKIIADENIPFINQAFAHLGEVTTLAGRSIDHSSIQDADILLVRSITQVNAKLLDDTKVKFVASATSGINHVDCGYLKQNNIAFAHALGSNAISVAQYVTAGICHWSLQNHKPLEQLSIGIVGYGHVGKQLEKICQKLGINCILNDPPLTESGQNHLESLNAALACDIVSLHVPLTTGGKYPTAYLINQHNVSKLKPDGLFINAARGGIVDESALLSHQAKHPESTIILDTWENEPNINASTMAQTLIATPHIAGYSFDGKIHGTEMIYQACCGFLEIKPQWDEDMVKLDNNLPCRLSQLEQKDIRLAILAAYNITDEDKRLRVILSKPDTVKAEYFDTLRKNYPIRREWIY